ncbi:MAG TPA: C39 family peptidase [Planktothrix sp.]
MNASDRTLSQSRESVKAPANLVRVPLTRQSTDFTCGVAALQSVLGFYGEDLREDELTAKLSPNEKDGTDCRKIESYCRESGYQTSLKMGMSIAELTNLIDQGKPVIVLLQAWADKKLDYGKDWNDGHYVVAIGHDSDNLFFMDPSTLGNYTYIPRPEFLERWHDTNGKERLEHFGLCIWKESGAAYKDGQVKRMD